MNYNMIMIGNKKQVFSTTFMVIDGQEAKFDIVIESTQNPGASTPTRIPATLILSPGDETKVSWSGDGTTMRFSVVGWRSPFGSCITEPIKFGKLYNETLYFQIAHYLIGARFNLVHFFVFSGEDNG